ncbi:MAG: hypothetical protein LC630_00125 [Bacteroidales bacterium]|nr:hypothetical protein [Bacteroidales bacterium]
MIFVPVKRVIEPVSKDVDSVAYYSLTIDKFFDPLDATYLQHLLDQKTDACGFQSDFACPVIVRIYFPAGKEPVMEDLVAAIESKSLTFTANDNEFHVKLPYKVITFDEQPVTLSKAEYANAMFIPTNSRFNGFSGFTNDVVSQYIVNMGANALLKARYTYLVSHLSNDKGVIAFETMLDSLGTELGVIHFVDTVTAPENIYAAVNADSLLFHYSDGRTGKLANPFKFPDPGIIK